MTKILLLCAFFWTSRAMAFPELVRHNYVNCTTCHVSPSGGGLLSEYGRALSKEVLSMSSSEGEEGFLWIKPNPEVQKPYLLGGDIRAVQTRVETPTFTQGRFLWMQMDLEGAYNVGKFTFDSTFGRIWRTQDDMMLGNRRYFAMYHFTDEMALRGGRFLANFGINTPNHFQLVRTAAGFIQNKETMNLEFSYLGEKLNVFGTVSQSPGEIIPVQRENFQSAQVTYALMDSYKVGASLLSGKSDQQERRLAALHGILGFTHSLYATLEGDFTWVKAPADAGYAPGITRTTKLGYEIIQGVHVYIQEEYKQTDSRIVSTYQVDYGAGFLFYPRPHFEVQGEWQKQRTYPVDGVYNDYAFLMMHVYL